MFMNCKFESLQEFQKNLQKLIILKWDVKAKVCICYCREGYTKGFCIHSLALEILKGKIQKMILLMPNKKKGRKHKASKALSQDQPNLKKIKNKPLGVQNPL